MKNQLIRLPYTLAGNEFRVLCYIDDAQFENLSKQIPTEVLDLFSSIGIAFKGSDLWFSKNRQLTARDREDIIARKFYELFTKHWNFDYGIPCLKFSGNLKPFDQYFVNRDIFIQFTLHTSSLEEQRVMWTNALSFSAKCTFIADLKQQGISHFGIFTNDHKIAISYLQNSIDNASGTTSKYERYDLQKILKAWETDEQTLNELYTLANATISDFLLVKQLNLFVPGFLFFTSINARRYRKAFEILTNKYNPYFVMTLPFIYRNKMYTVAFPICSKI